MLKNAAKYFGFNENYFYVMRKEYPEKFKYIFEGKDDPIDAYQKYLNECASVQEQLTDMYYKLEEKRLIYRLSRLAHERGLTKNKFSLSTGMGKVVFNVHGRVISYKAMIKYKKILQLADEVL
jgi:hypothetical protein